MSDEYDATIRELISRSLEAAKLGRYTYICIEYEDNEGDHIIKYRKDKGKEEITEENEH